MRWKHRQNLFGHQYDLFRRGVHNVFFLISDLMKHIDVVWDCDESLAGWVMLLIVAVLAGVLWMHAPPFIKGTYTRRYKNIFFATGVSLIFQKPNSLTLGKPFASPKLIPCMNPCLSSS